MTGDVNFPRILSRAVCYIQIHTPFCLRLTRSDVGHVNFAQTQVELSDYTRYSILQWSFLGVCFIVDLRRNNIVTTYERRLNVCLLGWCVQKKLPHTLMHRVIGKACSFCFISDETVDL